MARKSEVKKIRIDIRTRSGAKKLAKLIDDGWEIQAQQKRGALQMLPGQTDFVLTRARPGTQVDEPAPAVAPTREDEHEATSTPKWLWDGGSNPVKTPKPKPEVDPEGSQWVPPGARSIQSGTVPEKYRGKSGTGTPTKASDAWIGGIVIIAIIAVVIWILVSVFSGKDKDSTPAPTPVVTEQPVTEPPATNETPTPATPVAPPASSNGERETTDAGLDFGTASVACDRAGKSAFPYGWDAHWIMGLIGEEVTADSYFLKASVDIKNEFNAEAEMVVECTVTGDEYSPEVTAFDVY